MPSCRKILLVDDDASIRAIVSMFLGDFAVIQAEGVEEAERLFRDDPDIALVISDYHMKDGDGLELRDWVRAQRPVPFLIMSGSYSWNGSEDFAFLEKPFVPGELRTVVTRIMREPCNAEVKT